MKSEWISVGTGMPKATIGRPWNGLISDGRAVIRAEYYLKHYNALTGDTEWEWRSKDADCDRIPQECITYWMPLPDPPNKKR